MQPARAFSLDTVSDGKFAAVHGRKAMNGLIQEAVAVTGMVLYAMGLTMLHISSNTWWSVAEKWKTTDGSGPARSHSILLRMLVVLFMGLESCLP